MDSFWIWFGRSADVLGLTGLVYTIFVAKSAERAAKEASAAVRKRTSEDQLLSAIQQLKELENLNRIGQLSAGQEKWDVARRDLIEFREKCPGLSDEEKIDFQNVIVSLVRLSNTIDSGPDIGRMLKEEIDKLVAIQGRIRS